MSTPGRRRNPRIAAALLVLAQGACECDPWPEPAPTTSSDVKFLAVIPKDLDVHVDDRTQDVAAILVGKVYDKWGSPIENEAIDFAFNPPVLDTDFKLEKLTTAGDTMRLWIKPQGSTPPDRIVPIKVTHAPSGLTIDVTVNVMYDPRAVHGVEMPKSSGEYPAAGLASGEGATWKSNVLRAFVRRARFEKFDENGIPPANDVASGTALSSRRRAWRDEKPWAGSSGDMAVPDASQSMPAIISVVPVLLADDTMLPDGTLPSANLLTDLQGGADIIESSLVGARVGLQPTAVPGNKIIWNWKCGELDAQIAAITDPAFPKPDKNHLMVYMVMRSGLSDGDLPLTCLLNKLPSFPESQAIFLPAGGVESQSVAHEIAHALSLHHVGMFDGFFNNNLMVVPVAGEGRLRDGLSVGQAFHAALVPESWLVVAGRHRAPSLDCAKPVDFKKCPLLKDDIVARTP